MTISPTPQSTARQIQESTDNVEYHRPLNYELVNAGGKLIESSNSAGRYSHSPNDLWEFADGSRLWVTASECGEVIS